MIEATKEFDQTTLADKDYIPTLHDVHHILDEHIVGEYKTRMALFTTWVLGEKPIFMGGPRSSGKTFISNHVKALIKDISD